MTTKCILEECMPEMHSSRKGKRVHYFEIPVKDPARCAEWSAVLRHYISFDKIAMESARICSRHFERYDFCKHNGEKYLIYNAVPSNFDNINKRPSNESLIGACRNIAVVLKDVHQELPQFNAQLPFPIPSNMGEPFCRLCLMKELPLDRFFLPDNPAVNAHLVELVDRVAGIKLGHMDLNSSLCNLCAKLLMGIDEMIMTWRRNDELITAARQTNALVPRPSTEARDNGVKLEPMSVVETEMGPPPPDDTPGKKRLIKQVISMVRQSFEAEKPKKRRR